MCCVPSLTCCIYSVHLYGGITQVYSQMFKTRQDKKISPAGAVLFGCLCRGLGKGKRQGRAEVSLLDHLPQFAHPCLFALQGAGPQDHLNG